MKVTITDPAGDVVLRTDQEREAAAAISAVLDPLPPDQRKAAIDKMFAKLKADQERLESSAEEKKQKLAALQSLKEWINCGPMRLEKPQGSAWHKLLQAKNDDRLVYIPKEWMGSFTFDQKPHVFVVEHNWASAFAGAADFADGPFRLPFDNCFFEFRVDGRRVGLWLRQTGDEHERWEAFQAEPFWICAPPSPPEDPRRLADPDAESDPLHALNDLLYSNVRAVCIALDAEVAVSEPVRAPMKLNEARERKGKPLLLDYHVISLARRSRALPVLDRSDPDDARRRVRLHFRRGHWRHFPEKGTKTWIKWMLVGDPDLGFIDKHYRL